MSWSFTFTGAPELVKAEVRAYCAKTAENYEGWPEADDVRAVQDRVCTLIDAMRFDDPSKGVTASGYGSHSSEDIGSTDASPVDATTHYQVKRVTLKLVNEG